MLTLLKYYLTCQWKSTIFFFNFKFENLYLHLNIYHWVYTIDPTIIVYLSTHIINIDTPIPISFSPVIFQNAWRCPTWISQSTMPSPQSCIIHCWQATYLQHKRKSWAFAQQVQLNIRKTILIKKCMNHLCFLITLVMFHYVSIFLGPLTWVYVPWRAAMEWLGRPVQSNSNHGPNSTWSGSVRHKATCLPSYLKTFP